MGMIETCNPGGLGTFSDRFSLDVRDTRHAAEELIYNLSKYGRDMDSVEFLALRYGNESICAAELPTEEWVRTNMNFAYNGGPGGCAVRGVIQLKNGSWIEPELIGGTYCWFMKRRANFIDTCKYLGLDMTAPLPGRKSGVPL